MAAVHDVEKNAVFANNELNDDERLGESVHRWSQIRRRLLSLGVEERGIVPVLPEHRVDLQYWKPFFIWLSANFNLLSISTGMVGPVVFGLGLRDSCLIILFFVLLNAAVPAYLSTWGPKLGLRQMAQARYSFGYFGVVILALLNLATITGFNILDSILGGQTLSAVSGGKLSWTVGIVIIACISLFVSFCGYKVLNWYERLIWIPMLVVYLVLLGLGAKHFVSPPPAEPATARQILSFASVIAGFVITVAGQACDFTNYISPTVPSWRIFACVYAGLVLPIGCGLCLGAAFAVTLPTVDAWNVAYDDGGDVGGFLAAVLAPTGGFGKFLLVMVALDVSANVSPALYSCCLSFQVAFPNLVRVPRYLFSILGTAIIIPLAIVGSTHFYASLTNFTAIVGYWAAAYAAIIIVEHVVYRQNRFDMYDLSVWNQPRRLPTGLAALGAGILSFGLVVPSMDQVWFLGPIAARTGDLGFEVAFVVAPVLYVPLRWVEIRLRDGKL